MSDKINMDAVDRIITKLYDSLLQMKIDKPDLFNDKEFSKLCMIAATSFVCQLAWFGKQDVAVLQENIRLIWEGMSRNNSNEKPPTILN